MCIVSLGKPTGRVKASQSMVSVKGELIDVIELL
jgi:hypothetical protein